jgi:uncharacterized NTF2-like protein DUF6841
MLVEHYDHSEVLGFYVTRLHAASALYYGRFSRRRRDGIEIIPLAVMYVITARPDGRRISVLALHSPRGSVPSALVAASST